MKKTLIISGIVTIAAPLLGIAGTLFSMMRIFQPLEQSGVPYEDAISAAIDNCIVSPIAIGIVVGIFSLLVFIITLICWLVKRNKPAAVAVTIA
jgi:biopolymer transport protein ExbB/TolQ